MKKDIGFRFSEEAHEILLELSKEWGCTRTHVIERLLRAESPTWRARAAADIEKVGEDIAASMPRPVERAYENEELPQSFDPVSVPPTAPPSSPLTREEREAKMADAQRRFGMGGGKKK